MLDNEKKSKCIFFLGVEFKEDKNKKLGLFQFATLCETMLDRRYFDVFYHAVVVMCRPVS